MRIGIICRCKRWIRNLGRGSQQSQKLSARFQSCQGGWESVRDCLSPFTWPSVHGPIKQSKVTKRSQTFNKEHQYTNTMKTAVNPPFHGPPTFLSVRPNVWTPVVRPWRPYHAGTLPLALPWQEPTDNKLKCLKIARRMDWATGCHDGVGVATIGPALIHHHICQIFTK